MRTERELLPGESAGSWVIVRRETDLMGFAHTRYRVRMACCGAERLVTARQIWDQISNPTERCRQCPPRGAVAAGGAREVAQARDSRLRTQRARAAEASERAQRIAARRAATEARIRTLTGAGVGA